MMKNFNNNIENKPSLNKAEIEHLFQIEGEGIMFEKNPLISYLEYRLGFEEDWNMISLRSKRVFCIRNGYNPEHFIYTTPLFRNLLLDGSSGFGEEIENKKSVIRNLILFSIHKQALGENSPLYLRSAKFSAKNNE